MKLSTKTRYGTRAMAYLALHHEEGPCNVAEIARDQDLSPKYLEQIMAQLLTAGLVRSLRGAYGGYELARPSTEITLREVYAVLEGSDGFVECTVNTQVCPRFDRCATQEVWAEMHDRCMAFLESVTLAAVADRDSEKRQFSPQMYHI